MTGLIAGFIVAVAIFIAADHAAGGPFAFPFALLICVAAVAVAVVDGRRRG